MKKKKKGSTASQVASKARRRIIALVRKNPSFGSALRQSARPSAGPSILANSTDEESSILLCLSSTRLAFSFFTKCSLHRYVNIIMAMVVYLPFLVPFSPHVLFFVFMHIFDRHVVIAAGKMQSGEKEAAYHLECFSCYECGSRLCKQRMKGGKTEQVSEYFKHDDSDEVFCRRCYLKRYISMYIFMI